MIAILINSLGDGGAERVVLSVAREFTNRKIEIKLLCIERDIFYDIPPGIHVSYLTRVKKVKSNILKLLSIPILSIRLKNFIKKEKITVVQSHLIRSNIINVISKLLGSKHQCQIINHNIVGHNKSAGIKGMIKLFFMKFFYSRSDLLVYISKFMQLDFIKHLGLKNKNIIIPNPHNISLIQKKSLEQVNDFTFIHGTRYIVTFGRLIKRKKVDVILRAFREIDQSTGKVELVILGEGEHKEHLTLLAKSLGISQSVHFIGFRENPFKYISKCHLFILASDREGLPNVIIEAMACGLPVIASDCRSGPREILAPETDFSKQINEGLEIAEYGILTGIGDNVVLTRIINRFLHEPELWQNYHQKSISRAMDYNINKVCDMYKDILTYAN